jgi:hypothetical protein
VGGLSFTYFLLSELIKGVTLRDAYRTSASIVNSLRVPANAPQRPWMDDDGDGLATLQDGALASRMVLGDAVPFGALAPELIAVPADAEVSASQALWVEIEVGPGRVDGAEAVVVWSGANYVDSQPITDIAVVPLFRIGTSAKWGSTLPANTFPGSGLYNVLYTAYREDPLSEEIRFSSNVLTQNIQVGPPTPTPTPSPAEAARRALLQKETRMPENDRNGDGALDAADVLE